MKKELWTRAQREDESGARRQMATKKEMDREHARKQATADARTRKAEAAPVSSEKGQTLAVDTALQTAQQMFSEVVATGAAQRMQGKKHSDMSGKRTGSWRRR